MQRSGFLQILSLACVVVSTGACQRADNDHLSGAVGQVSPAGDSLAWSVVHVQATRRIETSTLETKDAAPGNQFIVLDVRVRNPQAQPQVLSEGSLVALDASRQHDFATPVAMLADEFLTLQVLPGGASVRGKIAFEVPEGLAGVFYWTPGNSTRRILLRVDAAPGTQRTMASTGAPQVPSRIIRKEELSVPAKPLVASVTPSAKRRPAKPKPPRQESYSAAREQARRDRCEAMLSENAPQDDGSRPFYLLNCPDYPVPSSWSTRAAVASAETPQAGSSPCSREPSHAAQLVCRDPYLATLDRRLAQSLSRALRVVDYPAALQREQDDWRLRVRDACDTIRCLELAYGRRTAHIDAVGKTGP